MDTSELPRPVCLGLINTITAPDSVRLERITDLRTLHYAYYDVIHMDDEKTYYRQLVDAVRIKAEELDGTAVRRLRGNIQNFQASISSVYTFLIDKGMLHSDPYKQERTITQIQIPSSGPFLESDLVHDMSQRMSDYVGQWEFLVNYFHVSLADLNLKVVQRILGLLDYIRWGDFSVNSSYQITRTVAGIAARVSSMNDPMAGKIFSSSITHLRNTTQEIRNELRTITVFLRERYKVQVRGEITGGMKIDADKYRHNPALTMDNVKFELSHRMKGAGWYKELIHELLEEDYGTAAEKLRAAALERLRTVGPLTKKTKRKGPDDKTVLLGILDILARTGEPIRSTVVKMNDNSRTLQERKVSLGERISKLISALFQRSPESVEYEIPIRNSATGTVRTERLNYTSFSALAAKKAGLLGEFQEAGSVVRRKASAAGTGKLLEYIEKTLAEVKGIHRNLAGLDEFFMSQAIPEDIRPMMKSTGLNLKNLKSAIADAMKAVSAYRTKKEEEEQLRKLGIED